MQNDKQTTIINHNTTTINNYGSANGNDVDNSVSVNDSSVNDQAIIELINVQKEQQNELLDKINTLEALTFRSKTVIGLVIAALTTMLTIVSNPDVIKVLIRYLGL